MFSLSILWVLGIELRPSGLAASAFTSFLIHLAEPFLFVFVLVGGVVETRSLYVSLIVLELTM